MAGPWERYQTTESAKPWERYASQPNKLVEYTSQTMSGVNEGIGNILGLPVDLATGMLNLGGSGINTVFGTQIPQITDPIGGSDFLKSTILAPTIRPESDDPGQQFARRIGQEVGAMVVPGAGPVARSINPLRTAAKELGAALLSGTGAATARAIAPNNTFAELAGQLIGGFTPAGVSRVAKRPTISSLTPEELRIAKNNAYKEAENLGVAYSKEGYDRLLSSIAKAVTEGHISKTRHAAAYSFLEDMASRRGKPLSLTELDQLRQEVRRDLINPSYTNANASADAYFGDLILDEIDNFIADAKGADLISGSSADASRAILNARELNTRLRKTELLQDAIIRAERRTASTGSGGNINNAIRQNVRSILDSKKKSRAFSKEELAAMEDLVRQGKTEDLLRWIGKFSPGGNGLIGMLQIGGTILNPSMAALPVAGMVAKGLADNTTISKAARLGAMISRGEIPPPQPRQLPPYAVPLLIAQGANANGG